MRYYIKKILGLLFTLFLVSLITFCVFNILPGNPATAVLGIDADPAQIMAFEESMNLNMPPVQRYLSWIAGVLKGDLGVSYRYKLPVTTLISNGFSVTASLAAMAILLTVIIGIPAGIFLANHNNSKYITVLSMFSQIGISVPSFCMGILLISIFSVKLNWFSSMGYVPYQQSIIGCIKSLFLPSLAIALGSSAVLIRYVRVSITKQTKLDYVNTAKSKGLNDKTIMNKHVLRNSLIPVITILGMSIADILGGSIIIENVFSLPGIGKLISTSISTRDLPLIQGLVLYLAIIVVICNFGADIAYSIVDPRIRIKQER